jgi:DNA polymerase-3 subunit delta'
MIELFPWQTDMWQRWAGLRAREPHALLLKGPEGTGKLDFAMTLAQSLLCGKTMFCGLACENCDSCHWFEQGTHPDFRLVQPEILAAQDDEEKEGGKKPSRVITVEQIRALSNFFNLSAHQGGYRVVLVHPAEAMHPSAANALLKSLEEPQGRILFILVTHKPQRLLPTIRSRCLALAAPLPPVEQSLEWLREQGIADPAASLSQAGLAPLQALRLAREADEFGEYQHLLQEIRRPASFDVLALAERLQKTDAASVIHWLQQWCYDLASARFAGTVRYHPEAAEAIRELAGSADPLELLRFHRELLTARREAAHPLNPRLLYESLLLSYRQAMLA